jgi:hypothetical protein
MLWEGFNDPAQLSMKPAGDLLGGRPLLGRKGPVLGLESCSWHNVHHTRRPFAVVRGAEHKSSKSEQKWD